MAEQSAAAVEELQTCADDRGVMIVSHGPAMTLYLDTRTAIHPVAFWTELVVPDTWLPARETGEVERLVLCL